MCFHPLSCSSLKPQNTLGYLFFTLDTQLNKKLCWLYLYLSSIWLFITSASTSFLVSLLSYLPTLLCSLNTETNVEKHKPAMALHFSRKKAKALLMVYTDGVLRNSRTSSRTSLPLLNLPKHTGCPLLLLYLARHALTSGPWNLLFPLPEPLIPEISAVLIPPSSFCSNGRLLYIPICLG